MDEQNHASISQEDADKIAAALEQRIVSRFHSNLGRGVWGLAWKAVLLAIVGVAAYGSLKGYK